MSAADARPVRGRLAPSPTGAQHLGNARTYLIAWLDAKSRGGKMVLRIEDIDTGRLKPGAADQIIEDLQWLGLTWDEGPFFQSQRLPVYREALDRLKAAELVYPCVCSRADILNAASAPHAGQEGITYPGTCSGFRAGDAANLTKPYAWRARFDRASSFTDRFHGPTLWEPSQIGGDFVVWRNDDTPAYQLAVAVDDAAMGITDVIRGDDLLSSTPKQLWIDESLKLTSPTWMHVPLVVNTEGKRFAKRDGDVQLKHLRSASVKAEAVIGLLAWSCGWLEKPIPITVNELLPVYRPELITRNPWVVSQNVLAQIVDLP
ncbi:tRNA glutamyl-Q(34) synthetase GluQRS [Zavarzinella formosa]|uniref:tRNA glutamyl-Q(34) synthetase GluQRS n=1 Tax=Zavarzinella formosa TaxID=360055 RepID=UPI00035FFFC6|nr:tRNA glutamyl-Q(34) synthetase GluQRS [Zavarzinella formosa]